MASKCVGFIFNWTNVSCSDMSLRVQCWFLLLTTESSESDVARYAL
jgi:hypothetical protein